MSTIVWLEQVSAADLALVGGKAANLGELIRAGFEVPCGFVVTTQGYHRRNPDGSVPAVIADEIRAAWRELVGFSGTRVAVRSSATAEDLAEASFAGQQETFLDVDGEGAVVTAVAGCWASLYSERAVAYRREHAVDDAGLGIAVVVQLMVAAEAAGVMFTANPVTGNRRETMITAALGLGEAVVAGTVNPDTFVIDRTDHCVNYFRRGDAVDSDGVDDPGILPSDPRFGTDELAWTAGDRPPEPLSEERAIELARIGDRIEAHFGVPQDIEWALDAAGLHILQARPITALPEPATEVPDEWPSEPGNMYFRASIVEQLPDPLTPLFADLMAVAVPASLRELFVEMSASLGRDPEQASMLDVGFPTVNGYAYYRYTHRAMWDYALLSMMAVPQLYAAGGTRFLSRWREDALPAYRAVADAWSAREATRLSAPDLLRGVEELLLAGCRYYTAVQTIIPLTGAAELAWIALHRTLIGARRVSADRYLLGFDSAPVLAEKALWDLATWVRMDATLAMVLADRAVDPAGAEPSGISSDLWRRWQERLAGYLAAFGHSVYDLDFAHPTPAEEPGPILQALRFALSGQAADPYARQASLAAVREEATGRLLASLDPARRVLVARTLRWAQRLVPIREDALAAQGLAWPAMRRLLGELGRRLVASEVLTEPDDVFWLTRDEAERAVAGRSLPEVVERIAERRALHRGQALLRPPQYLPVNKVMSAWDRFLPAKVDADSGDVLRGNAGSGGVVTGPARVISGPSDFADFTPGEILVAEITTPAYTPLFAVAGGVVTDIGGVLSHGSIVAREYGVPAVLGTGAATSRIVTGDIVTVDGGRGEVRLAGAQPAAPGRSRAWLPWVAGGAAAAGILIWAVRRRRVD
ncbi:MAG: phosphoenolpyruvate synthase [Propionibacteriaceae bacterium]|nr:phosphoenolpyruvate synthase [Propionibacteriaceae bacterium]